MHHISRIFVFIFTSLFFTVSPREIGNFFTVLEFKLPSQSELRLIQEELAESVGVEVAEDAVEAALGLTEFESETAFAS